MRLRSRQTDMATNPLQAKFRCDIDERGKVQLLPGHYNTEADEAAEREMRDAPTPDRTEAVAHLHFILGFALGAAAVLVLAAWGWAVSLR